MLIRRIPFNTEETRNLNVFLVFVILSALVHTYFLPPVNIETRRLTHLHYHFVNFFVKGSRDIFKDAGAAASVYFNGVTLKGIGGDTSVKLKYDEDEDGWRGRFPVPWGAKEGAYTVKLHSSGKKIGLEDIFFVKTRVPQYAFETPLKIMNLESMKRLRSYKIVTPEGKETGYEGIYDWIRYIGGNTLWYLSGQTSSYTEGDLKEDYPWVKDNLETLKKFSEETRKRGIDFGAWISCYMVFGNKNLKPDWYDYSYKYKKSSGRVYETDGISILDKRRLNDIAALLQELNDMESVSYIGLDYIRPAGGGLDLVDEFISAMEIDVPEGWNELTKNERMLWLGKIVTRSDNRNTPVIDKWNWWRAQRMAKIIRLLREKVPFKKPLWTFVLSWELGHQHGQDPIMFQDAGSDLIAVMMYEADAVRFDHIIGEWRDYLEGFKVNIAMGNQIDWVLHQYSVYPSGPSEYARRLDDSIENILSSGNLKGIFIHDFARAMWGRKGPYESMEWLSTVSRTYSKLNSDPRMMISIDVPEKIPAGKKVKAVLNIKNLTEEKLENIRVEFPSVDGVTIWPVGNSIRELEGNGSSKIEFDIMIKGKPEMRMGRYMVAARVLCGDKDDVYSDFAYLWVAGIPSDTWSIYR
ncbi:MAG: hypothetical protein ABIH89_08070 [Elusimicrobiota bacterium]